MSGTDELVLIGQLVKDAAQAKKNVALLKGKLEGYASALANAGGITSGIAQGIGYSEKERVIPVIPTNEEIGDLLKEFKSEKRHSFDLSARLKELGI